jgi:Protein of unknown function (DUF2795)
MARGVGGKSPANVAQYLSGINFPCQKEDLVHHARQNGAGDEVLEVLRNMPEDEYNNMADVMQGYGVAREEERETHDGRESRGDSHAQHAKAGHQSHQHR